MVSLFTILFGFFKVDFHVKFETELDQKVF